MAASPGNAAAGPLEPAGLFLRDSISGVRAVIRRMRRPLQRRLRRRGKGRPVQRPKVSASSLATARMSAWLFDVAALHFVGAGAQCVGEGIERCDPVAEALHDGIDGDLGWLGLKVARALEHRDELDVGHDLEGLALIRAGDRPGASLAELLAVALGQLGEEVQACSGPGVRSVRSRRGSCALSS